MSGFTKLSSSILTSSIWDASDSVRIVWITMLAMADQDGIVPASLGGIAHQARKTREETEEAITQFLAPDPDSKNPDNDGRRIERVTQGYRILNHRIYRELGMSESTKEYWRKKQKEHRSQRRVKDSHGLVCTVGVGNGNASGVTEGVKGEVQETRPGLLGLSDKIRTCRPEYSCMREMDITNLLRSHPDMVAVTKMVDMWCVDQANATVPMERPMSSLRVHMAKLHGTVRDGQGSPETDPGVLDYAKQLLAFQATRGEGIGDFYRKIRDNYGPTGVDRVKRAAKQIATAAQKEWMEREVR